MDTQEAKIKANMITLCEDDDSFWKLMEEANMETYYSAIEDITFRSEFFQLTVETAKAIVETYPLIMKVPLKERSQYNWKENSLLLALAQEIERAKEKLGCKYIFVRTSSRSPKDAALGEKGLPIYCDTYKGLSDVQKKENNPNQTIENMKLHAAYVMGTKALRVDSGDEAVFLLINSERLQEDFEHYIENPTSLYQICVRVFMDFEVELEFRGFVYKNKLTCITQYNEFCYFPEMLKHTDDILQKMKEFTSGNLIGKVPLPNYVIDFMLVSETPEEGPFSNLKVYIVEVNPLAEFAGGGMFTWEHDKHILIGLSPFEFRYATKPKPNAIKVISPLWAEYMAKAEQILLENSQL